MAEQRSTLIIEISSEQARRNAQALDRELRSIQNSGNYASTSMNSMSVACRQLAGYMMGIVTVGTAISKMDEFTNLNNRLRLVTDTQKELTLAMKDTFDIAQRSGAAWGGTATIYQKIQYNSEKLGLSQIQVAKVTESISKSISNSSSSAQAASAALYQLGQAFDKSSLNGDEFVSMSENAGYLMEVFSKGLGVTRAELKEMSSDGQLTTDKMIQAIQKMSGSIEDDFGKTNFTIGQGFTQVSNAVTKFVGESGQATGAATAISGSLGTLAENLNAVTNIAMIGGAYWLGSYIPAMYASVVAGYAKAKQLVEQTAIQYAVVQAERVAAAQELAGAEAKLVNLQATRAQLVEELKLELARKKKQISDQGAINSEMRMGFLRQQQAMINAELIATENALAAARTRSTAAAAASMGVGRGLLGLLTGPVGLGLTVAAVAGSYLMLKDSTKDTTSTLDLQKGTVAELVAEYSKLDDLQKRTTMRELEKQVKDLSTAYTVSFSDLNAFIGWLEDSGSVSESTAKEVNRLYKEYRTGGLSASDFATAINGLSDVQDKHKQKIDDLTTAQAKSKTKYEKVKTAQDALTKQTSAAVKANKDEAESINAKRIAQEKLNALSAKSILEQDKNNLWIRNANASKDSWGTQWSDFVEQFKQSNSLPLDKTLEPGQLKIAQEQFLIDQKRKNLSSQITNDAKDQTKEMEAQQKLQAKQAVLLAGNNEQTRNMLRVYQAFRSTGLPDKQSRVMTAQVGRENDFVSNAMFGSHKDRNNGYTNSGFISWQKGRSTQLMQYLQSQGVLDKKGNIEQTQDALDAQARFLVQEISTGKGYGKSKTALANDDLDYRSLEKIIGQNFIGWDYTGKYGLGATKASKHLAKQDNYHSQLSGILGSNPEIVSSSLKDISKIEDEAYKAKAKTEDDIRQLQAQFDTEAIQRSKDRDEQINQATILGQMDLIPKIWERYNKQEELSAFQLEMELNGYKWGEDQKIAYQRDISKLELEISSKYGKAETELRKNGIDALAKYEIDEYRKTQQLKIAEYQLAFSQPLTDLQAEVLDMQAKANMGGGYGAWALQNQYGKDLNSLGANYDKNVDNINEDKTITDDATRKQLLLDAEESFRLSKLALNEKYTLLEKDLAQSQQETQLSAWGNLLGQAQNTWGQITQSIKDANGEQSASFKTAFLAQQMFALGSAYVSTHLAAIQAMAAPDMIMFGQKIVASEAILAMGYANMALIGAQTIAGFATGGHITGKGTGTSDEIPIWASNGEYMLKTSAVNKIGKANLDYMNLTGELPHQYKFADGGLIGDVKVLDPQQNKDLTNYLSKSKPQGANIVINNNGSSKVVATQGSDGKAYITIDDVEQWFEGSMRNPNSKPRKSMSRNTTAVAKR